MNKHSLFLLFVSSLLAAVLAYAWAQSRGITATAQFSYQVDTLSTPVPVGVYGYDGYYHVQAAESVTHTFTAWLNTPEVAAAALQAAGQRVPFDTRQLSGVVSATQAGPQLVSITVSAASTATAQRIAQAVQAQADTYATSVSVALTPTPLLTGGHGLRSGFIATAVFFLIGFLGLNVLFLKRAFNEHRH